MTFRPLCQSRFSNSKIDGTDSTPRLTRYIAWYRYQHLQADRGTAVPRRRPREHQMAPTSMHCLLCVLEHSAAARYLSFFFAGVGAAAQSAGKNRPTRVSNQDGTIAALSFCKRSDHHPLSYRSAHRPFTLWWRSQCVSAWLGLLLAGEFEYSP